MFELHFPPPKLIPDDGDEELLRLYLRSEDAEEANWLLDAGA